MADITKENEKTLTKPAPQVVGTAKTPREALEQERARNPVPYVAANVPTDFDLPFKVAEDRPKLTPQEEAVAKEKAELIKRIGEILKAYHDNESSIPSSNEYWGLVAKYRTM